MPTRLPPTRMNLLRARRELARVGRGITLTRRKREALVVELFATARPAMGARAGIAESVVRAGRALIEALAVHGADTLDVLALPRHEPTVELRPATVWGIPLTEVASRTPVMRSVDARGHAPSLTGPATTDAAAAFERVVDQLIDAAPHEQRLRRLGDALAQSTQRLRTLEQRVAPTLTARIRYVREQLEEREREEQLRLRQVLRHAARNAGRGTSSR